MPKKISATKPKKATRKSSPVIDVDEKREEENLFHFEDSAPKKKRPMWHIMVVVLLIVGLIGLLITNRSMFIAAIVNGQPIFRWDLNSVLATRYGQQTLDGMLTERLIADEAKKTNISISQAEIDARGEEILKSFGSTLSVEEFLKLQGLSKAEFDTQLKLQLTVQKILSKDLVITDTDISNYIASNSATLIATEPGAMKEEAKNAILDMHVSEKFQTWIQEIREKASIQRFL